MDAGIRDLFVRRVHVVALLSPFTDNDEPGLFDVVLKLLDETKKAFDAREDSSARYVAVLNASKNLIPPSSGKWDIGGSPDMITENPSGSQLWISNRYNGSISVVDSTTGEVLSIIITGLYPHGLSYWPQPGRYSLGHNGNMR